MSAKNSPLDEITLVKRYAQALMKVAIEQNIASETEKHLKQLNDYLQVYPFLSPILQNPIISFENQKTLLDILFQQMNASAIIKNTGYLLAKHKKLGFIPKLYDEYHTILLLYKNIREVEITSAKILTEESENRITNSLKQRFKQEIRVKKKTDPSQLGGLIIRTGSKVWDGSMANKLKLYQKIAEKTLKSVTVTY